MIVRSDFESEVANRDVYKIAAYDDIALLEGQLREVQYHIIAKINSSSAGVINFLLRRKFLYSVSTLYFRSVIKMPYDIDIRSFITLGVNDLQALYEISDESFSKCNRYANDDFLGAFVCDIHRKWIANSLNGYADYCYGYLENGKISGFATLHLKEDHSVIGLIATSSDYRNKGIAGKMLAYLKNITLTCGRHYIVVGTESVNFPAINCYCKNNFKIFNQELCLYRTASCQ